MNMFLTQHLAGKWGNLDDEDTKRNNRAVEDGSRIFSAYETSKGRMWIITDAEDDNGKRNTTTILFPSDY